MKFINLYKKLYVLAVISVGITMVSCKKLIEIPANPSNQLSTARIFSDSTNIMSAVAAVYSNYGLASGVQFGSGSVTIYTGLTGDELVPGGSTFLGNSFYMNQILPDNSTVRSMWSQAYSNIFQMNICIEGITNTTAISAGLKSRLIAELKVSRAFYYFNMVNIWEDVPIITSTDYNVTQVLPRSPVAEVYKLILSDLTDAQQTLRAAYPSSGHARPNIYTAQALLSKVYLYLGQYQNAITAANNVIANGGFSLVQNLNSLFLDGSAESIWQLPANSTSSQTPEGSTFIAFSATSLPNYVIAPQLLAAFETGDLRKTSWLNFSTVNVGGVPTVYYYPYKYKKTVSGQAPIEAYSLLRLGEIYLIRAEALAQTDKLAEARADLNKIRLRANLGDVTSNVKEVVLNAILHERQIEMFCEWGSRWFDLRRSNTINTALAVKTGWKPSAALFPIPVAERQANPFLTQNPEY